jgi:hypothetical protein
VHANEKPEYNRIKIAWVGLLDLHWHEANGIPKMTKTGNFCVLARMQGGGTTQLQWHNQFARDAARPFALHNISNKMKPAAFSGSDHSL